MKINTTRFGEIEIEDNKIITFPLGIPGFGDLKRYVLIDYKDPVQWLHAVDDPAVAFIVVSPFIMFQDYSVDIKDDAETFLDIKSAHDTVVLVILTVMDNIITANLKAPLVMNSSNFTAVQILLDDERYEFKTPLPGYNPQPSGKEGQVSNKAV
ncbi:MAG: flagellar assembly protein FliW [Nitrospirae bacterium]|nr:flagellar assembly protein FliW [Nitrospirota bacterium]